jgi:hypothetical protein
MHMASTYSAQLDSQMHLMGLSGRMAQGLRHVASLIFSEAFCKVNQSLLVGGQMLDFLTQSL